MPIPSLVWVRDAESLRAGKRAKEAKVPLRHIVRLEKGHEGFVQLFCPPVSGAGSENLSEQIPLPVLPGQTPT